MRNCLALFLACMFTLGGCATSQDVVEVEYHPGDDVTTFETERIDTGLRFSEMTLGGAQRVDLLVRAQCSGQDCAPDQVRMYFYTGGGASQEIFLPNRMVRFEVGPNEFTWRAQQPREVVGSSPVMGEIVHIDLDLDMLHQIARANNVRGALGSHTFELSYERRAPLRELLDRLAEAGTGVRDRSG